MNFPTGYNQIIERLQSIRPLDYASSRNYLDGAVTYLSPYISRGVISTKDVFKSVLDRGFDPYHINKFIQELAWRDYWQQVWIHKGKEINQDLKQEQPAVENYEIPLATAEAKTGIEAVDKAIQNLYSTGYMHNHVRMYTASIACNFGKSHWKLPAKWMYYHLLDADWASNALSWQWVVGANSNKKYFANQENINKYCHSNDSGTFLDKSYEELSLFKPVDELRETLTPLLSVELPVSDELKIDEQRPTCIFNFYNLDPKWKEDHDCNRVLLVEPSIFKEYPVSKKSMDFMIGLSMNITGIQVFVGEFLDLKKQLGPSKVYFKEHPLNKYEGVEEPRDWMFSVTEYFPSFFGFWKKCRKEMRGVNAS